MVKFTQIGERKLPFPICYAWNKGSEVSDAD